MSDKRSPLSRGGLSRSLGVSLAGLRAGGALAVDGAFQKMRGKAAGESAFARREARHFVAELGRLKGSYVKIGQMLALFGEHFLPPALTAALHELNDRTEALPWRSIEPALREALGDRYRELDIDSRPLAAASLSQVHRATIRSSGEVICLKIQYPGLAEVLDADFDAVVKMLTVARWLQAGRELNGWLETMRDQLHQEIDYTREARLTAAMAERVAAMPAQAVDVRVPTLYPEYCGQQILAMSYIDGHSVNAAEVAGLSQPRRDALARTMLALFFQEVYHWGVLQTDPNFGNYLIRLDDRRLREGEDELVLLDFGSVLECEPAFVEHLRAAIACGLTEDREGVANGLVGLGCLPQGAADEARETFVDFCLHLLEPLRPPERLPAEFLNDDGHYCWARSRLMQRAGKQAARSTANRHFSRPSAEFALIARKLTGVFTFIAVLDAQFNGWELVAPYIQEWQTSNG